MLSISAICAARSEPIARPEVAGPVEGAGVAVDVPDPAGVGVAGITGGVEAAAGAGAGAAGGAGVEATAGAGVEGAFEVEAADAGGALG